MIVQSESQDAVSMQVQGRILAIKGHINIVCCLQLVSLCRMVPKVWECKKVLC